MGTARKFMGLAAGILLSAAVQGASYDEADTLFEKRGDDYNNALLAANMYSELAASEEDSVAKGETLIQQVMALYYYAFTSTSNADKKKYHKIGEDIALKAADLLKDSGDNELYATSYSWAGAHLGQWGLANGVLASLFKVPTLKSYMKKMEDLSSEHVVYYGHHRVLGRLLYKLPWPQGDKARALELFKEGFEQTLQEEYGVSEYGLNVVYYAEALINDGQGVLAKELLTKFVAISDYENYNSERIPETKAEQEVAKTMLENL